MEIWYKWEKRNLVKNRGDFRKKIHGGKHPGQFKKRKIFSPHFFFIQEAAAAGLEVKCGSLKKIDNYYGLSCLPINLELIRKVKFHDTGGFYIKIDIFKCKQCNTYYKIIEEYDSHHGSNYACMKLNETMEFYGGEIIEFKEEEINEL